MHEVIAIRDCARKNVMEYLHEHGKECVSNPKKLILASEMMRGINEMNCFIKENSDYAHEEHSDNHVKRLSLEEMKSWNAHLENGDGTKGGHWTVEQTTAVAKQHGIKFEHICENGWNVAMNMIYSDYYNADVSGTAKEIPYYVKLTKDFLFDEDGYKPSEKLARYYRYVAKH